MKLDEQAEPYPTSGSFLCPQAAQPALQAIGVERFFACLGKYSNGVAVFDHREEYISWREKGVRQ